MTAMDFEKTIDGLLSAKPFQPFTIELRGGSQLEIDDSQALRREGVSIFTDPDALSHYFDHESVMQISESPTYVARQPERNNARE